MLPEEQATLHDWQAEWDALPADAQAALDALASTGASEQPPSTVELE